ncbi:hypothetical protein M405DRAFT_460800 [Rhizopogon salebrosus TDB-379]|nr:hypothetical protein M405DRAFT_460800 [Rhizopogon salebrosus TDB-379]
MDDTGITNGLFDLLLLTSCDGTAVYRMTRMYNTVKSSVQPQYCIQPGAQELIPVHPRPVTVKFQISFSSYVIQGFSGGRQIGDTRVVCINALSCSKSDLLLYCRGAALSYHNFSFI